MDQVRREIEQEVRRLRASGVFPPSFERRLEDTFAQVVPTGVIERETAAALRHLESVSYVDVEVPTASNLPGGSAAKQLLRRLMAWYLDYLAAQLNRFMASTVRVLHLLDERVSALEAAAPVELPPPERGAPVDLGAWADLVVERLSTAPVGAPRSVLHAECGSGELLRRLSDAGIDAYGIDPSADLLDQAVLATVGADARGVGLGLDVLWADPLDHLRALEDNSLGGLVLSGCVDRIEVGAQRELAALAATKLRPGGAVVVLGITPGAWLARRVGLDGPGPGLVEADLAPGRPLHPETWAWMLGSEGLSNIEVLLGPSPGPGSEPSPAPADLELARIAALLSGPTSFAVVGTRPAAHPWP